MSKQVHWETLTLAISSYLSACSAILANLTASSGPRLELIFVLVGEENDLKHEQNTLENQNQSGVNVLMEWAG